MLKVRTVPVERTHAKNMTGGKYNTGHMRIRPVVDIYLDGPPEHEELCSIVWTKKGRLLKFVNRSCIIHGWGKVECIIEPIH